MSEVRIVAIRKDNGNHYNPNEAISHYQWESATQTKTSTREEMLRYMDGGNDTYVQNSGTQKAYCFVNKSERGTRFLQTHPDADPRNNLLNLPPC